MKKRLFLLLALPALLLGACTTNDGNGDSFGGLEGDFDTGFDDDFGDEGLGDGDSGDTNPDQGGGTEGGETEGGDQPGGNTNPDQGGDTEGGDQPGGDTNPDQGGGESSQEHITYLNLTKGGLYEGQPGQDYPIVSLENAIKLTLAAGTALPGKEKITNTNTGVEFDCWKDGTVAVTTIPTESNKILTASWKTIDIGGGDDGGNTNPDHGGGDGGDTNPDHGGGDEGGTTEVTYAIKGTGTFMTGHENGIVLTKNEGNTNTAYVEYMAKDVLLTKGDTFAIVGSDGKSSVAIEGQPSLTKSGDGAMTIGTDSVTVNTTGKYSFYYKVKTDGTTTCWVAYETIRMYVLNPTNDEPKIHAWNDKGDSTGAWNTVSLSKDETSGLWYFDLGVNYTGFKICNVTPDNVNIDWNAMRSGNNYFDCSTKTFGPAPTK